MTRSALRVTPANGSGPAIIQHASGLFIPDDALPEQVWTKGELKLIDRCAKLLHGYGISLRMHCARDGCGEILMKRHAAGDVELRCACTVRRLTRAF